MAKSSFEVVTSPEGIIMLPLAIFFDLAGIICTILIILAGTGYVAGIIVDIIAISLIMPWSWIRGSFKGGGGGVEETAKSNISSRLEAREAGKAAKATKAGKAAATTTRAAKIAKMAKWLRILTPIKNRVPGLGLIPTWTPSVWYELKS
jgi:hypothetical protein